MQIILGGNSFCWEGMGGLFEVYICFYLVPTRIGPI